jgi:hypothetical protein
MTRPSPVVLHEDSLGNLQCVRAVEVAFETRDMVKLEKAIEILGNRLRRQHNKITNREVV